MSEHNKKPRKRKQTSVPSLSSVKGVPERDTPLSETKERVYSAMNERELEKALNSWLKEKSHDNNVTVRDLEILKSIITEYLDTFMVFGYNLKGERIIIQHFPCAKDRDALVEFLKLIFVKQKYDNFLDGDPEEEA